MRYKVEYLLNVDGCIFINLEIVEASNKKSAFVKARNMGEVKYLSSGAKCVVSENINDRHTKIEDISNMDVNGELNEILNELNF